MGIKFQIFNTLIKSLISLTFCKSREVNRKVDIKYNTFVKYLLSLKKEGEKPSRVLNIPQKGYTPIYFSGA